MELWRKMALVFNPNSVSADPLMVHSGQTRVSESLFMGRIGSSCGPGIRTSLPLLHWFWLNGTRFLSCFEKFTLKRVRRRIPPTDGETDGSSEDPQRAITGILWRCLYAVNHSSFTLSFQWRHVLCPSDVPLSCKIISIVYGGNRFRMQSTRCRPHWVQWLAVWILCLLLTSQGCVVVFPQLLLLWVRFVA